MSVYNKFKHLLIKHSELVTYIIFGGLTTLVNWFVSIIFYELLNVSTGSTTIIAWVISVLFAYITNKIFVFKSKTTTKTELLIEVSNFFGARILSGATDLIIMLVGVDVLHLNFALVKLFSEIFVVIFNYLASKMFIFKKK